MNTKVIKIIIIFFLAILILPSILSTYLLIITDGFLEADIEIPHAIRIEKILYSLNDIEVVEIGFIFTQTLPALLGSYIAGKGEQLNWSIPLFFCVLILISGISVSLFNIFSYDLKMHSNITGVDIPKEFIQNIKSLNHETLKTSIIYLFLIIGIKIS